MKKQRKSRGLGMTFIIVCLVLSGCGAGTQEVALGSAEESVQAANTALAGQDSFTANLSRMAEKVLRAELTMVSASVKVTLSGLLLARNSAS